MILWYSGCGNSRFIAESLAEKLGDRELVFIPEAAREGRAFSFADGDVLGIVFPVYSWSVPELVSDFLKAMKFTGKPAYVFGACTCGDNTGHTERVLKRVLGRRGLPLDAFFTFQMPNTYINLPGFQLDSKELAASKIKGSMEQIAPTVKAIANREKGNFNRLIGGSPFFKTYILKPLFYAFLITDRKFNVSDGCTGCGLCAKNCPLGNITMENGRPHWNGHCTNCNSCYHHCPKQAIGFGRTSSSVTGQYFFK